MIVDLTVEDEYGVSIFADHGLIAAAKIDDFEAHRAKRNGVRLPRALLIRASMDQ
jgi:hypothetical protein